MNIAIAERLVRASRLDSDLDFEIYQDCCRQLKGGDDEAVLREMINALNDANAGEVQYELIEACESFPDDVFCQVMIESCEDGFKRSPLWFDLMFCSMINTERLFDQILLHCKRDSFAAKKIDALVSGGDVDEAFCVKWTHRGAR